MEFIVIARKLENGIVQYGYDAYGDGSRKIASDLLEKYNTPESVEELFSERQYETTSTNECKNVDLPCKL